MDMLGIKLKSFRKMRQLTQQQVADALGVNRVSITQWENGDAKPSVERLSQIAKFYNVLIDDLIPLEEPFYAFAEAGAILHQSEEMHKAELQNASLRMKNEVRNAGVPTVDRSDMLRDMPVLGTAACNHTQGAFQFESGAIDYVRRPPGLMSARDVYALYVVGDSMEPKFNAGDLVFIHPNRPARVGDAVVVQFFGTDQEELQAMVGVLHKRTAHNIELQKYNPAAIITLNADKVHLVQRILTNNELFGI